jgi:hypothetical protein
MHCRWLELRADKWHTDTLMAWIDQQAAFLNQAQTRNFQKWPTLGSYVWPNNFVGNTYDEEIAYLKTWITDRANWMDANMFGSCPNASVDQLELTQVRVFPNPAEDYVLFEFTELISNAQLDIYDHSGKLIHSATIRNTYQSEIDLTQFSNGMYTYRIHTTDFQPIIGKLIVQ